MTDEEILSVIHKRPLATLKELAALTGVGIGRIYGVALRARIDWKARVRARTKRKVGGRKYAQRKERRAKQAEARRKLFP